MEDLKVLDFDFMENLEQCFIMDDMQYSQDSNLYDYKINNYLNNL